MLGDALLMSAPPDESPFEAKHDGPVVRITSGRDGLPARAAARGRIARPLARVWSTIYDVERFAHYLPMVNSARRRGDSVSFDLKFRVGFFSAGFEFTTNATYEAEKWLLLSWTHGEPRDVKLGFRLTPDGESACLVETQAEFDVQSLGWLVKYFLKHHPEIQHGIFSGITLVLLDSIRRATLE
jgi:carbon monoxide dehydrogenase subunit G